MEEKITLQIDRNKNIPSYERQTGFHPSRSSAQSIHPLIRGANAEEVTESDVNFDSSPPARGRPDFSENEAKEPRFIPSHEGQTSLAFPRHHKAPINPLPRGANSLFPHQTSSWLRTIPSREGQTKKWKQPFMQNTIHSIIRGADALTIDDDCNVTDSSPHTRGRHPEIPFN